MISRRNLKKGGISVVGSNHQSGSEPSLDPIDFSYDKLNRLTSAVYSDSDDNDDAFSTSYSYDKHGNITAITRNAITDDIGPLPLDELHLSYTGNQLTGVSNTANVYEFSNYYPYLAPGTNAFTYDQNGNTTKDLNKSISSIQYNLLNLPRRITYSDGSMATYTYTSLGEKVQVVYSTSQTTASQPSTNIVEASEDMKGSRDNNLRTAMVPTTMNYCGNVIYNGNSLSRILLDGEGYATISKIPTYYFFIKDHLGNTRATLQSNGTVKQTNQYYPFGKRWDDMGETFKQPYLYNGKELDEMHDLSWYDYGARMYEPALGRFMTMDPMAEKYYNISPYAYCDNNPINYHDPTGTQIEQPQKEREKAEGDAFTYYGPIEKPLEPVYPEMLALTMGRAIVNGALAQTKTILFDIIGFSNNQAEPSLHVVANSLKNVREKLGKLWGEKVSFEKILENSSLDRVTKRNTQIFRKNGGVNAALDDFNRLKLSNKHTIETSYGKGYEGIGENVNEVYKYRPGSSDGSPTIEKIVNKRTKVKIRYDE